MNFVTKQQFEDALKVIDSAIKSGQLMYVEHEKDNIIIDHFGFFYKHADYFFPPQKVTFVHPSQSVKTKLLDVRRQLQENKKNAEDSHKKVQELEEQEKLLATKLLSLKE